MNISLLLFKCCFIHVCLIVSYVLLCLCGTERRQTSLNNRVSKLEDACRAKEVERVDLELRLSQVQENLKKSLAGGALGAPVEAKPPVKVYLLLYVRKTHKYMFTCLRTHGLFAYLLFFPVCVGLQQKDTEYLQ